MPRRKEQSDNEDWFDKLEAELDKKTQAITKDVVELSSQKNMVNRELIDDLWKIVQRFGKINIHFTIEPSYSDFAQFVEFPNDYKLRDDFNFAAVNNMQISDRTQDQGRMGDSLKLTHYLVDSDPHLRMVFEYCEGEQYYKYAGWKRIFAQFVIYDAPLAKFDMDKFHGKLAEVIKSWYESHLRKDRDTLIKFLKESFERGETFTQ
jgi:hemerythrin